MKHLPTKAGLIPELLGQTTVNMPYQTASGTAGLQVRRQTNRVGLTRKFDL